MIASRRNGWLLGIALFAFLLVTHVRNGNYANNFSRPFLPQKPSNWVDRVPQYPVEHYEPLPPQSGTKLPKVQHRFSLESTTAGFARQHRQTEVKKVFQRCWKSYRQHAWLQDELEPISGKYKSTFGGWAATLVDSLDTLWIMGMREEFEEAVNATAGIDFTQTSSNSISVFETTIRYLGGMLSAYDLSNDQRLLIKAEELANMLYAAFDTPNRMPINWWQVINNGDQVADEQVLSAEIGSLTLEFTRLSQITKDPKWYDAVQRIMTIFDEQQMQTNLPGLWPMAVNARDQDFANGTVFTLGAMADSLYEYLPKMHALLGGSEQYTRMYRKSAEAAIDFTLFRPVLPESPDVLFAGSAHVDNGGRGELEPSGQHLACFVGGMLALGGRLISNETHVELGRKVTDGCIWAYENSPLGVMPEVFSMLPCADKNDCTWNRQEWLDVVVEKNEKTRGDVLTDQRLAEGFVTIGDRRYILRPEALESVFLLYRITGDTTLMDHGWRMFEAIEKYTSTDLANAAITDMTRPEAPKADSMESFWTAETLKYAFLLFSDTDLISLDEYVFNTEAHPFKRPSTGWWR